MKRLMVLAILGMLLGGVAGCHVAECWRYAWNSRFHPEQNQRVVVAQPCVVADPCDPCPCSGGTVVSGPMVTQ